MTHRHQPKNDGRTSWKDRRPWSWFLRPGTTAGNLAPPQQRDIRLCGVKLRENRVTRAARRIASSANRRADPNARGRQTPSPQVTGRGRGH
jgi:hypothetical protein